MNAGEPVHWNVSLGYAAFGTDEALGFDAFHELGAGTTLRLTEGLARVRIGRAWIYGDDVRGWSVGLSLAPVLKGRATPARVA